MAGETRPTAANCTSAGEAIEPNTASRSVDVEALGEALIRDGVLDEIAADAVNDKTRWIQDDAERIVRVILDASPVETREEWRVLDGRGRERALIRTSLADAKAVLKVAPIRHTTLLGPYRLQHRAVTESPWSDVPSEREARA